MLTTIKSLSNSLMEVVMRDNFWWQLRWRWLTYIISFSLLLGLAITTLIVLVILFDTGMRLNQTTFQALFGVFSFWFMLSWALSFLIALIFSFKTLFNKPLAGKELWLLECESKEPLVPVILADVIPIWRKFLFWMVWILLVVVLLLLGVMQVSKTFFGGVMPFIMILSLGVVILKPLLLSIKNVRLHEVRRENP